MTPLPFHCNLIFLSGALEEAWFLHCLSGLNPEIGHVCHQSWDSLLSMEESNAFDIYYTNPTNSEGCEALEAIRFARSPQHGHGLLIGADENFLANPAIYVSAKFVIRTYLADFYRHPRIMTIPEGPFYAPTQCLPLKAENQDMNTSVFFSGQIKYSRIGMARAFAGIKNSCIVDAARQKVPAQEYLQMLSASRFSLCPNGNTTPDTLRLYEALEMGIVPIAERTWIRDYLGSLFPDCPIPRFSSWVSARHFILSVREDDYHALSRRVSAWWCQVKQSLPTEVRLFVMRSLEDSAHPFQEPRAIGLFAYRIKALSYLISISSLPVLAIRARRVLVFLKYFSLGFFPKGLVGRSRSA